MQILRNNGPLAVHATVLRNHKPYADLKRIGFVEGGTRADANVSIALDRLPDGDLESDMRSASDRMFPPAAPVGSLTWKQPMVIGVGDTYVTSETQCAQLETVGHCRACTAGATPLCTPCQDINSDGLCDDFGVWGFRNEANWLRYFWDIIDTHAEPGDDTNLNIGTFAARIANIPCSSAGAGVDGNCNEPSMDPGCMPVSLIGRDHSVPPVYPAHALGDSTRDSYNARDIHQVVNTGGSDELARNCLASAQD